MNERKKVQYILKAELETDSDVESIKEAGNFLCDGAEINALDKEGISNFKIVSIEAEYATKLNCRDEADEEDQPLV